MIWVLAFSRGALAGAQSALLLDEVMDRGPRPSATIPDCTSSRTPNGSSIFTSASSLSLVPVASTVTASRVMSMILARNISTIETICGRVVPSDRNLSSNSSRCTAWVGDSSTILSTLISLFNCLVTCSSGSPSTATTIVIRETSGFSVGPTASEWMLNPRRENNDETRASTPGLFSTSTDNVWRVTATSAPRTGSWRGGTGGSISPDTGGGASGASLVKTRAHGAYPGGLAASRSWTVLILRRSVTLTSNSFFVEEWPDPAGGHDLVVAGPGGDHRPHLGIGADDEIDHHRTVVDGHRGLDRLVDVLARFAAQTETAVGLGEHLEIRD